MFVRAVIAVATTAMFCAISVFSALSLLADLGVYNPYPTPPTQAAERPVFGRHGNPNFRDLYRKPGEPVTAYKARLVKNVNEWMIHYWPHGDYSVTGVHPIDNLALWAKSNVSGYEYLKSYEFVTPETAWLRGYGFCSQVSRIVSSVLNQQGIAATIVENPRHVVVESGGMVLDADRGVTIPYSLDYLRRNPSEIARSYSAFPSQIHVLTEIYLEGFKPSAPASSWANFERYEWRATLWSWVIKFAALWISSAAMCASIHSIARFRKRGGRLHNKYMAEPLAISI